MGSTWGGIAAKAPAMPVPTDALTKRPKSSAGHVVNCPASRRSSVSNTGQPRSGRNNLLTIGARCCVISTDCIQNVDNSQVLQRPGAKANTFEMAPAVAQWRRQVQAEGLIRIGLAAWRVAPRPQRMVIRRTTSATSSSGSPTGQTAVAATRSGESPATSKDASPSRG